MFWTIWLLQFAKMHSNITLSTPESLFSLSCHITSKHLNLNGGTCLGLPITIHPWKCSLCLRHPLLFLAPLHTLCLLPHFRQLAWIRDALNVNGTSRWRVDACAHGHSVHIFACPSFNFLFPPLSFNFNLFLIFFSSMFLTSNLSAEQPLSAPAYVNAVVLAAYTIVIRALLFREHAMQHDSPICECQRVNAEWGIINASLSRFSHHLTNLFTPSRWRTNTHARTHKCTNEGSTPEPWTTEDKVLLWTKLKHKLHHF